MIRKASGLLTLLALSLSACQDDPTVPTTLSTVTVRAYVDSDGSGSLTSSDTPLSGVRVVLTSTADQSRIEAQTGANGVATFSDVQPGGYTASLEGTPPAGAVLATASTPVVAAPFQGGELTLDFRYVFNPGAITGVVFRDDNRSNAFEANQDTPAGGVTISLFADTTGAGTAMATTVTNSAGAFSFPLVRPGRYAIVTSAPFPTLQFVGGSLRRVTVAPVETTAVPVQFTGSLISTIAEIRRQRVGTRVAAEGVVTAGTTAMGGRNFYIQDRTSGIIGFFNPAGSATTVAQGDSVRVIGVVSTLSGEMQLDSASVTRLGTGTMPAPRIVTAAEIAANAYEGQLLRVHNVEVVSVGGGTGAAFNVTFRDAGGTQFTVRVVGTGTGLTRSNFVVGQRYDVTGVLGSFNGAGQLKPRSPSDLGSATTPLTIAQVRQRAVGTKVSSDGVVTASTAAMGGRTFYLQDATAGIMGFFSPAGTAVTLSEGENMRVFGTVNTFSGEMEIDSVAVVRLGTGTVPAARVATAAEVNANTYEGQLLRVNNVEVVTVGGGTGAAFNVTLRDTGGTSFTVRVVGTGTGITRSNFALGQRYDVLGVLGSFNGTGQLKPRRPGDIILR